MNRRIENESTASIRHELIDEALDLYEAGNKAGYNWIIDSLTGEECDVLEERILCNDSQISVAESLFEMATLRKYRSHLPMNLYLDDSGSYLDSGHGPRIKFQKNKNDSSNTREMIPMTISDNPEIPLSNYKLLLDGISEKDIKKLKDFVVNNKDILLRLCDKDDEYDIQRFMNDMVI